MDPLFANLTGSDFHLLPNSPCIDAIDKTNAVKVWIDDNLPAGVNLDTYGGDSWNWVPTGWTPFPGAVCHKSPSLSGIHQHLFTGANPGLTIGSGDMLRCYVYIDPANPPRQVMLQWNVSGNWEHRAYWGENLIQPGWPNNVTYHRYMGMLPAVGQWVALEVPASVVGLEGKTVTGMAFTLYDGGAYWDLIELVPNSILEPVTWIDDSLPAGVSLETYGGYSWNWVTSGPAPFSGTTYHRSENQPGIHQHFFTGASPGFTVDIGDIMKCYIYIDPANPPRQIMLQWNVSGNWEHRAYWGENLIDWGSSRTRIGNLPASGKWVALEVPAAAVGLEGKTVTGMAFTLYDGAVSWDLMKSGRLLDSLDIDSQPRVMGNGLDIGADEFCLMNVSQLRKARVGEYVNTEGNVITAAFPDMFYIEDDLRVP